MPADHSATMYGLRPLAVDLPGPRLVAAYDRDSRRVSDLALYHNRAEAMLAAADINTREEMGRVKVVRVLISIGVDE